MLEDKAVRTLYDALESADHMRKEVAKMARPNATYMDIIKLADAVKILAGALETIAEPLSEVPKAAAKDPATLVEYYENLAAAALKVAKGESSIVSQSTSMGQVNSV